MLPRYFMLSRLCSNRVWLNKLSSSPHFMLCLDSKQGTCCFHTHTVIWSAQEGWGGVWIRWWWYNYMERSVVQFDGGFMHHKWRELCFLNIRYICIYLDFPFLYVYSISWCLTALCASNSRESCSLQRFYTWNLWWLTWNSYGSQAQTTLLLWMFMMKWIYN